MASATARLSATNGTSNSVSMTGSAQRSAARTIRGSMAGACMSALIAMPAIPAADRRSTKRSWSAGVAGMPRPVLRTRSPGPSHSAGSGMSHTCAHRTSLPVPVAPAWSVVPRWATSRRSAIVIAMPRFIPTTERPVGFHSIDTYLPSRADSRVPAMGIRVAVDIGGTFTDLVAVDETSGRVHVHKASSSPTAPIDAVRSVFAKAGLAAGDVSLFVHGTTVATNALIERDGTRIAFVTNRGFRDVLFIQDGTRRDLYSLEWHKPRPLVARYDCLEVGGRIDADGEVVAALDDEDVAAVVAHLRAEGIRSVAIGLVFAQANPDHELELEARLRAEIPDLATSLSHRVFPRWRENDRWQTVVADAYLKAMFARYVRNLEGGLEETGVAARLVLMKSNGGVVEAATAAEQPVNYLVSGPVGGVLGGSHFARQAGFEQIMTIDIGGTSSDVSLVAGGDIPRVARYQLDHGIPIKAPMIDITTIGAGGGSIGWVDAGGLLRVGPRSAGSTPGPACFGRGGTEPAIADANLVLGRLDPDTFCGGEIRLDVDRARAALDTIAQPLGLSVEEAAQAMLELATHDMVDALRVISIDRGIDARDFALVAIGGAGGLHGAEVARTLGIGTVIVPRTRQHVRLRAPDRRPADRPVDDAARARGRSLGPRGRRRCARSAARPRRGDARSRGRHRRAGG